MVISSCDDTSSKLIRDQLISAMEANLHKPNVNSSWPKHCITYESNSAYDGDINTCNLPKYDLFSALSDGCLTRMVRSASMIQKLQIYLIFVFTPFYSANMRGEKFLEAKKRSVGGNCHCP